MKAFRRFLAGILVVIVSLLMALAQWLDEEVVGWFVAEVLREVVNGLEEVKRD